MFSTPPTLNNPKRRRFVTALFSVSTRIKTNKQCICYKMDSEFNHIFTPTIAGFNDAKVILSFNLRALWLERGF